MRPDGRGGGHGRLPAADNREEGENPYLLHEDLQKNMQNNVGIIRTDSELQEGIQNIENLKEKNKNIKKILITSNTLSSSKVLSKFKLKKTIHQFFPIDSNFLTKNILYIDL